MINSTNSTSTSGVTLISAIAPALALVEIAISIIPSVRRWS
ncbi:hypothetical protein [Rhodanobacter lindaniclasticus]